MDRWTGKSLDSLDWIHVHYIDLGFDSDRNITALHPIHIQQTLMPISTSFIPFPLWSPPFEIKNTFLKKLHVTLQPFPTIYGTTIYTLLTDAISKPVSQWRPFDGNEGIDGNRLRMFRQCGQSVEESNASV